MDCRPSIIKDSSAITQKTWWGRPTTNFVEHCKSPKLLKQCPSSHQWCILLGVYFNEGNAVSFAHSTFIDKIWSLLSLRHFSLSFSFLLIFFWFAFSISAVLVLCQNLSLDKFGSVFVLGDLCRKHQLLWWVLVFLHPFSHGLV